MLDLGFLILLTLAAAGFGLRIVARLAPGGGRAEDWTLAVPLGLGSMSLFLLGLAEIGMLTRPAMAAIIAIGFPLGFHSFPRSAWECRLRRSASSSRSGINLAFDSAIALIALGSLLTALAPATDGDALCYHLQVPKIFLERGSAVFEPDLHETVYPLATEMLFAPALAFRGPVACRLISWLFGLSFAASVWALARPVLGDRARWASAIALGVPAISNGMGAPLNDVALAAFGNAALVAFFRWKARPMPGSAILVGMLAGMAIGVKYPALVWAGLLGTAMLATRFHLSRSESPGGTPILGVSELNEDQGHAQDGRATRSRSQRGHGSIALFAITALLIGGPWYLRAYLHTGNPVFPFFRAFFGSGIDDVLDPIKRPMAVSPWNLLTALGPMTLDPDRFDSVAHQFGPAFLLFLPGLFLIRPPRRLIAIAGLGWAFLTLCLTQRQSMRFVLIAVGPLSVAVAWAASRWWDRGSLSARLLVGILIALLFAESTIALARSRHGLAFLAGKESESAYLDRREPTYRVGRLIDAHLPISSRIIGQDHRGFYIPRPYTMELAHRRRTGLGTHGETAENVIDHLKKQGFTHLLLCPPIPESAVEFDPTLGRLLAPWLAGRKPLFSEEIADSDGVIRRYSLYEVRR